MGEIKRKANHLIKKFETNCPFKIAKQLGIFIQYEDLGNILGYYSKHFRIPIIHINENADEKQRRFICAHELGHAVLHPDTNTSFLKKHTLFSTDKIEVEANTFAVELLLSDIYYSYSDNFFTIHEAIETNGIPVEVIILKKLNGKKIFT